MALQEADVACALKVILTWKFRRIAKPDFSRAVKSKQRLKAPNAAMGIRSLTTNAGICNTYPTHGHAAWPTYANLSCQRFVPKTAEQSATLICRYTLMALATHVSKFRTKAQSSAFPEHVTHQAWYACTQESRRRVRSAR